MKRLPVWIAAAILAVACGCSHSNTNAPSEGAANTSAPDNGAPNAGAPNANAPNASAPSRTSGSSGSQKSSGGGGGSASSAFNSAPPAPAPVPVVIPRGTVLTVALDQTLSTKENSSGDRFAASLAEPVTVDGAEVLRTGTRVSGTVVQAHAAGRVKGGAVLALTLDSIAARGSKYSIETAEFEDAGKGRGKRTAIGGGGGAAFGAIVGAIAGGGKGAAIGALAGGGAGTAGAAFTGKRDITIPAETRLHFKLAKSVTISQQ